MRHQSYIVFQFHTINELCGEKEERTTYKPDFVFEVLYSQEEEDKFMKLCGDKEVIHAYHGSKAENFYSILHHGLRNNMTKVWYTARITIGLKKKISTKWYCDAFAAYKFQVKTFFSEVLITSH